MLYVISCADAWLAASRYKPIITVAYAIGGRWFSLSNLIPWVVALAGCLVIYFVARKIITVAKRTKQCDAYAVNIDDSGDLEILCLKEVARGVYLDETTKSRFAIVPENVPKKRIRLLSGHVVDGYLITSVGPSMVPVEPELVKTVGLADHIMEIDDDSVVEALKKLRKYQAERAVGLIKVGDIKLSVAIRPKKLATELAKSSAKLAPAVMRKYLELLQEREVLEQIAKAKAETIRATASLLKTFAILVIVIAVAVAIVQTVFK